MILFYTKRAGLTKEAVDKLATVDVTAIEIKDMRGLHWQSPESIDWISKGDEIGVMMIRAIASTSGADEKMGRLLMAAMRRQHDVNADGSMKKVPSP